MTSFYLSSVNDFSAVIVQNWTLENEVSLHEAIKWNQNLFFNDLYFQGLFHQLVGLDLFYFCTKENFQFVCTTATFFILFTQSLKSWFNQSINHYSLAPFNKMQAFDWFFFPCWTHDICGIVYFNNFRQNHFITLQFLLKLSLC